MRFVANHRALSLLVSTSSQLAEWKECQNEWAALLHLGWILQVGTTNTSVRTHLHPKFMTSCQQRTVESGDTNKKYLYSMFSTASGACTIFSHSSTSVSTCTYKGTLITHEFLFVSIFLHKKKVKHSVYYSCPSYPKYANFYTVHINLLPFQSPPPQTL